MNFHSWTQRPTLDLYHQKDLFRWVRNPDLRLEYNRSVVKTIADAILLRNALEKSQTVLLPLFAVNRCLSFGPKVVQPGSLDFKALEQTDINLTLSDYSQPYDCLVIEFSESYQEQCKTFDLSERELHWPCWAIVCHEREANIIIVVLFLSNEQFYSIQLNGDETIKDIIASSESKMFDHSLPTAPEEIQIFTSTINACLNCCLFLDTFGCKKLGPKNEKYFQRLQHFAKCAAKRKKGVEEAHRAVRSHPIYYGFRARKVFGPFYVGGCGECFSQGEWFPCFRLGSKATQEEAEFVLRALTETFDALLSRY